MSHLSTSEILKNIKNGNIIADGVDTKKYVKDQSIDVSLGEYVFVRVDSYPPNKYPIRSFVFEGVEYSKISLKNGITFYPGMFILAYTNEFVGTKAGSNLQPSFKLKSTSARLGIQHPLAGLGEVGFFNRWCLELTFAVPVELRYGDLIGQVYFDTVIGKPTDYSETGSYQSENTLEKIKANWKPENILPKAKKNIYD